MAIIVDNPIAESIEYRPPTQSQKPNMFAVSIPNFATSCTLVETATKWSATARRFDNRFTTHSLALCALVIVSCVVNVLDDTMNSVSSGLRSRVASAKSVPSTFDTKRNVNSRML